MLYRFAFHSPNKTQNNDFNLLKTPQMDPFRKVTVQMISKVHNLPYEPVTITSHDGLKLFGKYYEQKENAPLAICFHGYRGTAARDFSGGTWIYLDAGFNLLMIDERAHGKSEGHTITLFAGDTTAEVESHPFGRHYFTEAVIDSIAVKAEDAGIYFATVLDEFADTIG